MAGSKTKTAPSKKAAGASIKAGATNKLPAALVKRVEQQVAARRDRLLKEARADIALIRRRQAEITEAFYDVGEALARLKRPGVAEAVGRATFKELCEKDLEMGLTTAERLIAIVTRVPREDALRMGQERAFALVQLADATPEADSATMLEKGARTLPSGKKVDLAKASVREIHTAAKEIRAAKKPTGKPRGRTTTVEERAAASALQSALRGDGFESARVTAVATRPGAGAHARIEGVPLADMRKLGRAIGKLA